MMAAPMEVNVNVNENDFINMEDPISMSISIPIPIPIPVLNSTSTSIPTTLISIPLRNHSPQRMHEPVSTGTPTTTTMNMNMMIHMSKSMTEDEQSRRRASIKEIMQDGTLTPLERRKSIQSLMDGRRQSSGTATGAANHKNNSYSLDMVENMTMIAAATAAAADFYDSEDDSMPHTTLSNPSYGYNSSSNNNNNSSNNDDDDDDDVYINDDRSASSLSSGGGDNRSVRSTRSTRSGTSSRTGSRRGSEQSYPRVGRAESLKNLATSTAAAAAAILAAHFHMGDDPENKLQAATRMEKSRPECDHYERQCSIISPCCQLCFGCRICHDECPALPPPFINVNPNPRPLNPQQQRDQDHDNHWDHETPVDASNKKARVSQRKLTPTSFTEEDTHHLINRFDISEVICRQCYTRQCSKTNICTKCNIQFGEYHCNICNLWMSANEDPYHCMDCGFCRVGGQNNFRHCHDCGMCIDALLFANHNCKAGKYMSNCPVCQEDLFSSRSASHEMPCGHAIHWHCFKELTSFDTRCPVCKKTAETHDQMQPTWDAMATGIALQPIPPEMARVVTITCNDCEGVDEGRRWHFLGVQCLKCHSFNTSIDKTILMGHDAAIFFGDDPNAPANNDERSMFLEVTGRIQTSHTSEWPASEDPFLPEDGAEMDDDGFHTSDTDMDL